MGTVYSARDPELGRKVAIKLLNPTGNDRSLERNRLLREAQAMARLDHPNVASVFDFGEDQGRIFLALELVEGEDLRTWLRKTRPLKEVIDKFAQAARGLAAAHEKRIVHRDFKPENVMVGKDGRVRVLDFGLAHPDFLSQVKESTGFDTSTGIKALAPLLADIARDGALVGTPAYMAPEQITGETPRAAADQFSFCLSLYEAVYGAHPFAAESIHLLLFNIAGAQVPDAPAGSRVPTWLRRILVRGLSENPGDRWPSMDAVADELIRDRGRPKRYAAITLGAALLLGGVAVVASQGSNAAALCADMERHLAGIWGEPEQQAAQNAILETGVSYAADTWSRTQAALDDYLSRWVEARKDACEATNVHGEQSDEMLDLRMNCLDECLRQARELVGVLSNADEDVVEHAAVAAISLPRLERCDERDALIAGATAAPTPSQVEAVDELTSRLSQIHALRSTGRYDEALALMPAILTDAEAVAYAPTVGEVQLAYGILLAQTGKHEDGEERLENAYFIAERNQLTDLAARAAGELVVVVGRSQQRISDGRRWVRHALADAEATSNPEVRADLHSSVGRFLHNSGDFDEAIQHHEAAISALESLWGEDHLRVAHAYHDLGATHRTAGSLDEARKYIDRAAGIWEARLGRDHPTFANSLNFRGLIAAAEGDDEAATRLYTDAAKIYEKLGDPLRQAYPINNLAEICSKQGDLRCAREKHEKAIALWQQATGPDSPHVIWGTSGLVRDLIGLQDRTAAIEAAERVHAFRSKNEARPALLAEAKLQLGQALSLGEPDDETKKRSHTLISEALKLAEEGGEEAKETAEEAELWLAEKR
jgi:tetratricopeptide (TPR) repeat protein/tRNA A-37 threonylcarbamoyl transferase component Bud32